MSEEPRQRIERSGGTARRARLTPAPGTDVTPEAPVAAPADAEEPGATPKRPRGTSDDDRITRERPPHW
ncbi:hypothetical protein [Agromyces bauzanensis]